MAFYLNRKLINDSEVLNYITKYQYYAAMREYRGKPLRWKTKAGTLVMK